LEVSFIDAFALILITLGLGNKWSTDIGVVPGVRSLYFEISKHGLLNIHGSQHTIAHS